MLDFSRKKITKLHTTTGGGGGNGDHVCMIMRFNFNVNISSNKSVHMQGLATDKLASGNYAT